MYHYICVTPTDHSHILYINIIHRYIVRPEVTEQIENTTDIPISKNELIDRFPDLQTQISTLPECWWYRHPKYRNDNNIFTPQHDAELLHSYKGEEPASESKESVRNRVKWFFKWLFAEKQRKYSNIVVYSHSCTMYEMERFLRGIPDDDQSDDEFTFPENTEIRSFELLENILALPIPQHLHLDFDGYYNGNASINC